MSLPFSRAVATVIERLFVAITQDRAYEIEQQANAMTQNASNHTRDHGDQPLWVRDAPKVLLHDHLDGGVRPETIVELAEESGYDGLPCDTAESLAEYLQSGARRKDLELYLEMFVHTVAVMRTPTGLERVAREAVQDYRSDGVVYAEVRFAPSLLAHRDFGLHDVVETALGAIADESARPDQPPIYVRVILDAMRNQPGSVPIVDLVDRYRDGGVVGFDIAGPELGHPASAHAEAFARCRSVGIPYTIHAGEGDGVESIRQAVDVCQSRRIGHGVRIVEDRAGDTWGPLAQRIRDDQIVLEVCPTSNVHTGIAPTIAQHPIELLRKEGFAVTVNTDNRTMSGVTLSGEWQRCVEAFGWDRAVMGALTRTALGSAFADDALKDHIETTVLAGFYDV